MSDDVVIRAEGLGKKYVIGHETEHERYTALRDVLARGARNAWRKAADLARGRNLLPGGTVEEFWALKDVSFEVRRGEVLGIIGRNGAGKSTLLKILSRITEPSEGRVAIKGRVASLLEVGTGFHPELTGRENIYLNGAILGMTRAEIRRKFDEIVAFAEIEKFLDTPVKRYSSGMYVRLAFAVAAHLEPEILIVDEVLAVGDAEFQKKCLGKMRALSTGIGRTVLFVSHNLEAIQTICGRCIFLDEGMIKADGEPSSVTNAYVRKPLRRISPSTLNQAKHFQIESVQYIGSRTADEGIYSFLDAIGVRITFVTSNDCCAVACGLGLINEHDQLIFGVNSREEGIVRIPVSRATTLEVLMPHSHLLPGRYSLWLQFHELSGHLLFEERNASEFWIMPPERDVYTPLGAGLVYMPTQWRWTSQQSGEPT